MPEPLQVVAYVVPARYYLIVLRGVILKGAGLSAYPRDLLFLGTFAALVLALAWVRLVRKEG